MKRFAGLGIREQKVAPDLLEGDYWRIPKMSGFGYARACYLNIPLFNEDRPLGLYCFDSKVLYLPAFGSL